MENKVLAVAVGIHIFTIRDETPAEKSGLIIPDQAQKKPNTGTILSIGKSVKDKGFQVGRKAIWNAHVGQSIEIDGVEITVLKEPEILGII